MNKLPFYTSRLLALVLFLLLFAHTSRAQMIWLPDTNFRNELIIQGYGSCIIGDSIDPSCPFVFNTTVLNVSVSNIYNLRGIEAFVNLHKLNVDTNMLFVFPALPPMLDTLTCARNQLASLPALFIPLPGPLDEFTRRHVFPPVGNKNRIPNQKIRQAIVILHS